MLMGWRKVYEISSNRQMTKAGKNHLTEHQFDVLSISTEADNAAMLRAMLESTFAALRLD